MTDLAWRFAREEDVTALVTLIRSAYRGEMSRAGWTSEADLVDGERIDEAGVFSMIALVDSWVLVVEDEGDDDGLVACCHVSNAGSGVAAFGTFAVAPGRQGGGLGRWLVAEAEGVASDACGARELEIKVIDQQSALLAWYERLGFVRTGEVHPFVPDPRYARLLRDDLQFVVLRKPIPR